MAPPADCSFASREPDEDWYAVAHGGGPARAFDRMMPAFGEALAREELERAITYMRGFCADAAWPRGELNFPRALVTEKAFPEDEAVLSVSVPTEGALGVMSTLVYERRFGPQSQLELIVPFGMVRDEEAGRWAEGIGDVAVGVKSAVFHQLGAGTIFSVAGELILPTGDEADGFGSGRFVFEPFLAYGQRLPWEGFLQLQVGVELPLDALPGGREGFARAAIGRGFSEGR